MTQGAQSANSARQAYDLDFDGRLIWMIGWLGSNEVGPQAVWNSGDSAASTPGHPSP